MPKLKTHKGAAARIHVTGSGKLMRRKRMSSHNRLKRSKSVLRQFAAKKFPLATVDKKRIRRLIPHSF